MLAIYAKPVPARPYSIAAHSQPDMQSTEVSSHPHFLTRLPIFIAVVWANENLMRGFYALTGQGRRGSARHDRREKHRDSDDDVLESGLPFRSTEQSAGVPILRTARWKSQFHDGLMYVS